MTVRVRPKLSPALMAATLLAVGSSCLLAQQSAPKGDVDALVAQLTSEDRNAAEGARGKLKAMGTEVVPALFENLLAADWTLRPRLLEVLSAHGRDFADSN